jgi:hypothetical protein
MACQSKTQFPQWLAEKLVVQEGERIERDTLSIGGIITLIR